MQNREYGCSVAACSGPLGNVRSIDTSAAGAGVRAVPLPASFALLLGALGVGAAFGRLRAA